MNAQQLPGMTIVSLEDADRLGTIVDVMFATEPLHIAAVRALGDNGGFIVPFDRLHAVGRDAVTVESRASAQADVGHSPAERLVDMSALLALKVVDEDGRRLGVIESVDVDDSGQVSAIEAHTGGVLGVGGSSKRINAESIRSVGSEVVTVRAS